MNMLLKGDKEWKLRERDIEIGGIDRMEGKGGIE